MRSCGIFKCLKQADKEEIDAGSVVTLSAGGNLEPSAWTAFGCGPSSKLLLISLLSDRRPLMRDEIDGIRPSLEKEEQDVMSRTTGGCA
jgi:hypothetical protein